MSGFDPCLIRSRGPSGEAVVRLGAPLLDAYLEFLAGRCRPNTVLAAAYDLKVFFAVVAKAPGEVCPADVLGFITAQRIGRVGDRAVLQSLAVDGEVGGVSTATVARRLSTISGLFAFLQVRGDVATNPVPRGLPTRRERSRPGQGVPLTRRTRRLPKILTPADVDALTGALGTHRDRAMVAAMVLGGLRRCEVLGLRMEDVRVGERRVFIADGKGGHQRLIPISARFFTALGAYLDNERPAHVGTDRVFLVLKGPRRGQPLAVRGLDEILSGARRRAGLSLDPPMSSVMSVRRAGAADPVAGRGCSCDLTVGGVPLVLLRATGRRRGQVAGTAGGGAHSPVKSVVHAFSQGHARGRCSVRRRAEDAIRAGT